MKHIITSAVAIAVLVGVVASGAHAGPIKTEITLATATNYGGIAIGTDSVQNNKIFGPQFNIGPLETEAGVTLQVYYRDTVAAAADNGDTVVFRLVRKIATVADSVAGAGNTQLPKGWAAVYNFAAAKPFAANFPLTKHIPKDSFAVYNLTPGTYAWIVGGGVGQTSHYLGKAYKFDAFVTTEKNW